MTKIPLLAHSGDPKQLASFLYGSDYPGDSGIWVAPIYIVSLYLAPLVAAMALISVSESQLRLSRGSLWQRLAIMTVPILVWLTLAYVDAAQKAVRNVREVLVLGAVAGVVAGFYRKTERPAMSTPVLGLIVFTLTVWTYTPKWI